MSYDDMMAILPSLILGIFCGLAAYFKGFMDDLNHKPSVRVAIANMLTSSVMSFVVFAILDGSDFTFMSKLAISSLVAFLGVDKALELAAKIFSLKGGGK